MKISASGTYRKPHPRGGVSLRTAVICFFCLLLGLAYWTYDSTRENKIDDREVIVFWGSPHITDQLAPVLRAFEAAHPEYKVIYSVPVTKNVEGDGQRLLCAIAGGVPPDVVFFDRFAIGEWASKDAFEDLTPWIEKQDPNDPHRIDLEDYYKFTIEEASYRRPGSDDKMSIYGIPSSIDLRMLYMNMDMLNNAGLTRAPKNWEELSDYAYKLTKFRDRSDPKAGITRLGFGPNEGNSWLYLYAWQAGGEFLSPDRTKVTMSSPEVVRALKFNLDVYDRLGGYKNVMAFKSSFQKGGAQDPFLSDQMAMRIDGSWNLSTIAAFKKDMNFAVAPPPLPQSEIDKGRTPLTWAGGFAYIMPKSAQNKSGAFKLIQFLQTDEVLERMEDEFKQSQLSAGKLYLPRTTAKQKLFERTIEREVYQNDDLPETFKNAYRETEKIGRNTYIRPVTPVGQMLWNKHMQGYELAVTKSEKLKPTVDARLSSLTFSNNTEREDKRNQLYCEEAMKTVEKEVQAQLDKVLAPPTGSKVNWWPYFIGYGLLILIPFAAIYLRTKHAKAGEGSLGNRYQKKEVGWAMFFAAPWLIGMVIFIAGPILFSIVISFTSWDVMNDAHYVGLDNYRQLAQDDMVQQSLGNTVFMLIRVPLSMIVGLIIAIMMNRAIRGIGIYRTIFYLPAIMPIVASSFLWLWLLNPNTGPVNQALDWIFDTAPFEWIESTFMSGEQIRSPQWFQDKLWAKPAMIIMNIWTAGSGMIIWLAGLQAIPKELYEAAKIDGANAWQRFWRITIPMLTPYILFNLIMGTIATLQIFNEAFIMTQGGPESSTTFYAYYLFQQSFQYFRMGYASAMAWILFLIVLALTALKLWSSKKWVHYSS